MDIPIQIANGTSPVIVRVEDPYNPLFYATLLLAIFTGILALVVTIGNRKTNTNTRDSNKLTLQSNNLLRTEIESTFRPIISRHVYEKKKYHPSQINDDTCSITPEKVMFHLINTGTLPAIEMSYKYYLEKRDQPSKTIILKPTDSSNNIPISSLAPSEYYSLDIPFVEINTFENIRSGNQYYFGMIVWYSDENSRKYYYHMEGFFERSALILTHVDIGEMN